MCFAIGGAIGATWGQRTGQISLLKTISWRVYVFGTAGLFGYHFLYFSALRNAPAAEAGLLAYLWPILIVLFSGLLPGDRLATRQVLGAAIAFSGAGLVLSGGISAYQPDYLTGYMLALGCALVWSTYSVLSRAIAHVPTISVAVFCLASSVLSLFAHLAFETTRWPSGATGWLAILLLGIGPLGVAFFMWDIGMKKGDIQLLGVASYAAPVVSTVILIIAGVAGFNLQLLASAFLVFIGALVAARAH